MASSKVLLITLCSLVLLSQLTVPAHSWGCCLRYTKRQLPCKRMLSYKFQNITQKCDINAIVFHQSNGKLVCADPLSLHSLRCMKCVNQRRLKEAEVMKTAVSV